MKTDADQGGTERITVSSLRPQYKATPRHDIALDDLTTDNMEAQRRLVQPHGVFIVKGWTRMLSRYTVMAAARDVPHLLKAGHIYNHEFAALRHVCHCMGLWMLSNLMCIGSRILSLVQELLGQMIQQPLARTR